MIGIYLNIPIKVIASHACIGDQDGGDALAQSSSILKKSSGFFNCRNMTTIINRIRSTSWSKQMPKGVFKQSGVWCQQTEQALFARSDRLFLFLSKPARETCNIDMCTLKITGKYGLNGGYDLPP